MRSQNAVDDAGRRHQLSGEEEQRHRQQGVIVDAAYEKLRQHGPG
jgi:hypothetical protein